MPEPPPATLAGALRPYNHRRHLGLEQLEVFIQLLKEADVSMSHSSSNLLIDPLKSRDCVDFQQYLEVIVQGNCCFKGKKPVHRRLVIPNVLSCQEYAGDITSEGDRNYVNAHEVCYKEAKKDVISHCNLYGQCDAIYGSPSDGLKELQYKKLGAGGSKRRKEESEHAHEEDEPTTGKKPRIEEAKKGFRACGSSKRRQHGEHAYDEDEPTTCKKPRIEDNIRLLGMAGTSTMLSRLGGGARRMHLDTNVFPDLRMRPLPTHPRGRLLDRIDRSGLILKHVKGDGNCQFRSLSKVFYKTQCKYHAIRLRIVSEMRRNKHLYMEYGTSLGISGMRTIREFDDYLATMSRDRTWGDIITLYAASNVFKVRASIISSFEENVVREVVPECMEYKRDVYLSYVYYSEDDAHYDALVHRDDLPSLKRSRSRSPVRRPVRENFEVVVDNIPHSWRSYDLRGAFEKCVAVANARVIYNRHGISSRFGYVEIKYERDVGDAVAVMNGSVWDGRRIHVERVIENYFDREAAAGM